MFETEKPFGRPRQLDLTRVIEAILYLLTTGCQWRYLPMDYPKRQSVYYYFRKFERTGKWREIHDRLRAEVKEKSGRHKHLTAVSIDSQSVKTVGGVRVLL